MRGQLFSKNFISLATTSLFGTALFILLPVSQANTQEILRRQGTLQPATDEYTFSGSKGQSVIIKMESKDFDTSLILLDPDGVEIASNEDFARSSNSAITITLPANGTYKVLARAFTGGGNYTLTINPATPYDLAYANAASLLYRGRYDQAIAAYTQVLRLHPNDPISYADRGDAYVYKEDKKAGIADYQRAMQLYQQAGNTEAADTIKGLIQSAQQNQ